MWIDTHCHLASARFAAEEIPALLERARAAGVGRMVTLATSLDDAAAHMALTCWPGVHACVGIHPCDVHHAPDDAVERLRCWLGHPGLAAMGETGLDYFHPAPQGWEEASFRQRQRHLLEQHFALAAEAGLNVVIHTRDRSGSASFEDALAIYRRHHDCVRAVFHCFVGDWNQARQVLDLGGLVSFGGVATFRSAHQVRDALRQCPAGGFMLETDAPYLAPEPHRGQRNEPAYVALTAERIAAVRGETCEELARHTGEAAAHFFRFCSDSN